jgi:glycine/D-amino acid oxidase-like deaminating enzyme
LDKFIIDKESERVIGIETGRGRRLRSDAIVIACAVNSKHLVGKLKVSVPVMPFKGYTVSVKLGHFECVIFRCRIDEVVRLLGTCINRRVVLVYDQIKTRIQDGFLWDACWFWGHSG